LPPPLRLPGGGRAETLVPPGFAAPEARANQGDAARGAGFWTQCKGCHETAPDRPTLTGILGRRAAGNAGFRYSKNMARIGTDGSVRGWGTLDAHIENRKASAKRMTCRGVKCANTCWSLFAPGDAVKVGAHCEPTPGKIASVESFISQTGEAAEPRRASHEESLGWCAGITTDILGWRPNCAKGRCAPADPQPALRRRGEGTTMAGGGVGCR